MKTINKIIIPAMVAIAITGCAQQTKKEEYISAEAAKALALEASGVVESDAVFEKTELDSRNGINYYKVDFSSGGQKYEYDVDAVTGVVIDSKATEATSIENTVTQNQQSNTSVQQGTNNASGIITENDAKEIALNHAGLKNEDVTFIKTGLERDDGVQKYEIEFYSSNYEEYDYEINAVTGEILSYDYDAEHFSGSNQDNSQSNKSEISADEAKNIALSQVPGATLENIHEFEVDYDDGRLEYEGKIYYSETEYEFSIDGYSGAIRSWESESIYN